MFSKILIANRGEISCRIIKSAKRLGIKTVAIFSEQDRNSLHVQMSDEAYCVGPAQARDSYLNLEKIVAVCKESKSEAVHPGYGFLAENPEFAELCKENGIVFMGPEPEVIRNLGIKSWAKQCVQKAGVPCIPGYHGKIDNSFSSTAGKIGYPLLIKAERGGGGKGIRLVEHESDLITNLHAVQREAKSSFGSDEVILEKYIHPSRHIEVQFFSDTHGNCVHLFERDCSLQRRHQKIIEESPATSLSDNLREKICSAAIKAAQSMHYTGAGTVEFLLDQDDNFYFMEINTRLQVEHPVTEMQTGYDLVEWQFKIAAGEPIPAGQDEISYSGHSIEARIYAENPDRNFLPSTGILHYLRFPKEDNLTRIDSGVREKDTISSYYDPMIAKLIVHGDSRTEAIKILKYKLKECAVGGIRTNLNFLQNLIQTTLFQKGDYFTDSLDKDIDSFIAQEPPSILPYLGAATFIKRRQQESNSPWCKPDSFRINHSEEEHIDFAVNETGYSLVLQTINESTLSVHRLDNAEPFTVEIIDYTENSITIRHLGTNFSALIYPEGDNYTLHYNGRLYLCAKPDIAHHQTLDHGKDNFLSPMPGRITALLVKEGQAVKESETLMTLEAMKMEYSVTAHTDGVVTRFLHKEGDTIEEGAELLIFSPNFS